MGKEKRQLSFFTMMGESDVIYRDYGGDTHRDQQLSRPLDRKKALHIVLKSDRARGGLGFRASAERALVIDDVIRTAARKFGVQVDRIGNAGHRIHLLVQFSTRSGVQRFLRRCVIDIAREVTETKKGQRIGKFWDSAPYSRIVERGKDYAFTRRCVELNDIQGACGSAARAHLADKMAAQPWWSQRPVLFD